VHSASNQALKGYRTDARSRHKSTLISIASRGRRDKYNSNPHSHPEILELGRYVNPLVGHLRHLRNS
jgi:hypothetical protein